VLTPPMRIPTKRRWETPSPSSNDAFAVTINPAEAWRYEGPDNRAKLLKARSRVV